MNKHLCVYNGCKTRPSFNNENKKNGLYCYNHKLPEMVDVVSKRCIYKDCKKRPNFNKIDEKVGIYCLEHKLPEMINVNDKRCIYKDCNKYPVFNFEGETKKLYCVSHKLPGMINVKDKRCIYKDCNKQPSYNNKYETNALYCKNHKLPEMINIISRTCIYKECTKIPNYNNKNETKGVYCLEHKLPEMVDVAHKKCNSEWCDIRAIPKYNNYCLSCCIQVCPEIQVSRNYKTKERDVSDRIDSHFKEYTWVNDKIISGGCSKRRPDKLLDLGTHIIIVEVDENKHNSYDTTCENKRLMELSQDLGFRPIVFIRFNPDSYKTLDGTVVRSCWKVNKFGITQINKIKEWEERIKVLNNQIRYWIETISEKTIEIVELFY
jgi:hypothetical protein